MQPFRINEMTAPWSGFAYKILKYKSSINNVLDSEIFWIYMYMYAYRFSFSILVFFYKIMIIVTNMYMYCQIIKY